MSRPKTDSSVLTIRVPATLDRRLAREARRRRTTRSEVARAILESGLASREPDLVVQARQQSLLAARHPTEQDALAFVEQAADVSGWRGQE